MKNITNNNGAFKFKTTIIFTAILICFALVTSIPAQDADSSKTSDTWTGFYVGGYGGMAITNAVARTSVAYSQTGYFPIGDIPTVNQPGTQDLKATGFNGGGTFGYNHQSSRFFLGAETDVGAQNFSRSTSFTGPYLYYPTYGFTITQSVKSTWGLTVRPRAGIASKRALIYGTGGLALTDISYSTIITDNAQQSALTRTLETANFKKIKAGWTAGGGVEFKIVKHWSAKAEYCFSDFGRVTTNISAFNLTPGQPYTHSAGIKASNLKLGFNYRF